jgi:hypothetical protein
MEDNLIDGIDDFILTIKPKTFSDNLDDDDE